MLKVDRGEVSEWSNVHAWKACVVKSNRGFESRPLRQLKRKSTNTRLAFFSYLVFRWSEAIQACIKTRPHLSSIL